jgi:hypothetical protein
MPSGDLRPDRIDGADDLMSGNARVFEVGEEAFLGHAVAVADAAGFYLDPDLAGGGFGNIPLDQLERTLRTRNLGDSHLRHGEPPANNPEDARTAPHAQKIDASC